MTFQESVEYLLSLGNEVSAMKLGLENIRKLVAALGNPQNNFYKVQIAGTNGKGSVCAFLNSICLRAGIRTGMTTSPHLVSVTERVVVNGNAISEDEFARLATRVRETAERLVAAAELDTVPTYFEQVTSVALLAFAEAKVEIAILETGLGGRLDATTAAEAELVAITRIDLDHQAMLGGSLAQIAAEKAAIIHEGSTTVVLPQSKEVEAVIRGRCREVGVEPIWATTNITTVDHIRELDYPIFTSSFKTAKRSYPKVDLGLIGRHQAENASVAIALAESLGDAGFDISDFEICTGLETAEHPGRLSFAGCGRFLLDGAHNIGGARSLAAFLKESIARPVTMVFGAMGDKDVSQIAEVLFPLASHLVLTRPANSRAAAPSDLAKMIPDAFKGTLHISDSCSAALQVADSVTSDSGLIVITGSLYLVGEALSIIRADA